MNALICTCAVLAVAALACGSWRVLPVLPVLVSAWALATGSAVYRPEWWENSYAWGLRESAVSVALLALVVDVGRAAFAPLPGLHVTAQRGVAAALWAVLAYVAIALREPMVHGAVYRGPALVGLAAAVILGGLGLVAARAYYVALHPVVVFATRELPAYLVAQGTLLWIAEREAGRTSFLAQAAPQLAAWTAVALLLRLIAVAWANRDREP